jgi:hypothetical protein
MEDSNLDMRAYVLSRLAKSGFEEEP